VSSGGSSGLPNRGTREFVHQARQSELKYDHSALMPFRAPIIAYAGKSGGADGIAAPTALRTRALSTAIRHAFCQLHNSLAGGNSGQVGIAADGAALPEGPATPDPALKPDAALDPTEPLEP
jgi:hypothetical protein